MTPWIISDTHFFHEKIKEYEGRPDNFDELIIKYWKEMVKPDDLIIHLGDVSFKGHQSPIKDLPGKKILVRGNHDPKSFLWYIKDGFDFCCDSFSLKYYGRNILFTHKPIVYVPVSYDLNIHGHVHTKRKSLVIEKQVAVRLEENEYKPVLLSSLIY